jgi:hypothetical protein
MARECVDTTKTWRLFFFSLCIDCGELIRTDRSVQVKYYLEAGQGYQFSQQSRFAGIQTAYSNFTMV